MQIPEQRRYTGRAEALLLELSSGRESPSIDMRLFVGAVRMGAAKAGLLAEEKQHRVCGGRGRERFSSCFREGVKELGRELNEV